MTAHRYLLDDDVRNERRQAAFLIASAMETEGSAWPGVGAGADIKRLQDARRIAWTRWAVGVGAISDHGAGRGDG